MLDEAHVLTGLFPFPRLQPTHGEGSFLFADGKSYLDFTAGLGVMALGHGRRDLAAVAAAQMTKMAHASNLFGNAPALALAARLLEAAPMASKVWFANSGSEVNEAALKFARLHGRSVRPNKHAFVAFERGFHGRTLGALAVTHTPAYREPFAPELPGARFARLNDIDSVRAVLDDDVCAVMVEPVQGEGGVHPCTVEFLRALRSLCDAHDALLIFDEVQCGLGRLGQLFAHAHYGVVPDIVTLAKPLGGGLPIGATLVNERVAALLRPGQHGSTFGGNPVACAVGDAVLSQVAQPAFLADVRARGARLAAGLDALAGPDSVFVGRRGIGLMQALVVRDGARHVPAQILIALRALGLLVTRAGDDAVRLLPPLTVSEEEIDMALQALREVAWRRS